MTDATASKPGWSAGRVAAGAAIVIIGVVAGLGWGEAASARSRIEQLQDRIAALEGAKPGIGEAMLGVNTHLTQAYFAGLSGRWELTAHELEEIGEAFDLAAALKPEVNGVRVAEWVGKFKAGPGATLAGAVARKDRAAWIAAVDEALLTCNACHTATQHAFVNVGRPTQPPSGALLLGP